MGRRKAKIAVGCCRAGGAASLASRNQCWLRDWASWKKEAKREEGIFWKKDGNVRSSSAGTCLGGREDLVFDKAPYGKMGGGRRIRLVKSQESEAQGDVRSDWCEETGAKNWANRNSLD